MSDRLDLVAADDWWRGAVVYQVYPRSFADSNGDGIGDLGGLVDRLDHLNRLGVDAVWLSPIYASPHADNGYDISDYQAIDPVYGSLADFDRLVGEVHRRDMRLIMDLVVNHTSDRHAWFRESATSIDDPMRDWYWWRPPRAGCPSGAIGAEPNNWESFFSGSVWTLDPATGEYYLHLFSAAQPDLNWENPDVRHAVHAMMRWWLDRGIDGFRMDVINLISKDPELPDATPVDRGRYADGSRWYANGPRLHEFLREMRREVFRGRDRTYLTVGEMPGVTIADAQRATDPRRGELDMVFQFDHVETDFVDGCKWGERRTDRAALIRSLERWQTGLAGVGWNSLYLGNHDQPRAVSRFGNPSEHWYESATALATMLHLLSGTPFIYQGDELGMTNAPFSAVDDLRDIESLNRYAELIADGSDPSDALAAVVVAARDHARTPMQWSSDRHGGFTDGTPWIAANPNSAWLNAERQVDDPNSVFAWYRRLIDLRHREPAIVHGAFRRHHVGWDDVFAFGRTTDVTILVIVNLSDDSRIIDLDGSGLGDLGGAQPLMVNLREADEAAATMLSTGAARPWEAAVWRIS